jgi:hypothetical protein
LRATHRLATLGEARLNQRLSTELKFRTRLYQSR